MHKNKVMRKLLGQPTIIANESGDNSVIDSPQLRPSTSQNTVYSAGAPIACLDRSPDGQRVVIAGSKVFKVLKIDGSTITEDIDLRAIITSYASNHDLSAASPEQLNVRAVSWSHGTLQTSIITACGNGKITVYDLNRAGEGLEVGRINEHARQVHKLAVNPFKPSWLLSASQDGTVKSFDIRVPSVGRSGPIFSALKTYKGNAEAVRDVKWSPSDGMEFACSTDAGVILKWDARKSTAPIFKLTAHTSACFSISWHPDGDHLVSGGMDQSCYIWDMSKKADRNQKPRYSFTAPAPVSNVSWRPAFWSATAQGRRAAQVTVAYDEFNTTRNQVAAVHIWDLARPTMPFKEIEDWDSSPTGILWNTKDILWSVDKEGHFTQTDVAFIPPAVERRRLSTFSFSPGGDVLMFLEERQHTRRSRPSLSAPDVSPSYPRDVPVPSFSASRSDSEEDVIGSFLGPRLREGHRRRYSGRSNQMSTTPPTSTEMTENKNMSLDEAVNITSLYKPRQIVAIGHAPSTTKRAVFQFYTNKYLFHLAQYQTNPLSIDIRTSLILENYAKSAEEVRQFRLAQSWRLLGYTTVLLLTRRAEYHRQQRLTPSFPKQTQIKSDVARSKTHSQKGTNTPKKQLQPHNPSRTPVRTPVRTPADSPLHRPTRSIGQDEHESTSNVTTPLVRPVRDIAQQSREAMHTSLGVDEDPLALPDAAHSTSPSPIPVPGVSYHLGHTSGSMEGYDFYGIDSFPPGMPIAAPPKKQPLRLEYTSSNPPSRIQPHRHDSQESFQMFSTSGESQVNRFMSSSESESQSFGREQSRDLRERVHSWEHSYHSSIGVGSSNSHERSQGSVGNVTPSSNDIDNPPSGSLPQTPPPPILRIQEASAPSMPKDLGGNDVLTKVLPQPAEINNYPQDPHVIPTDFEYWPGDPDFTIGPIDPTILVQRMINFELQTGALNSAVMILLLRPLLAPATIDEIQALAILRTYEQRLTGMKMFQEAALLRNLCVPLYPEVFSKAQQNIAIGYFCTDCNKPIENDPLVKGSMWRCTRCKKNLDSCAICKSRDFDASSFADDVTEGGKVELGTWFLCPGCGHGGHAACMQVWHSGPEYSEGDIYSDGCCPLEGCLHPCLPGKWRIRRGEEKAAIKSRELEGLVREKSRGSIGRGAGRGIAGVRRDAREVNQSKAVEGVRMTLAGGVHATGGSSGGSSLERKKSVKLVAPGEERRPV